MEENGRGENQMWRKREIKRRVMQREKKDLKKLKRREKQREKKNTTGNKIKTDCVRRTW